MLHCGFLVAANKMQACPKVQCQRFWPRCYTLYMVTKWLLVPPIPARLCGQDTCVLCGSQHSHQCITWREREAVTDSGSRGSSCSLLHTAAWRCDLPAFQPAQWRLPVQSDCVVSMGEYDWALGHHVKRFRALLTITSTITITMKAAMAVRRAAVRRQWMCPAQHRCISTGTEVDFKAIQAQVRCVLATIVTCTQPD